MLRMTSFVLLFVLTGLFFESAYAQPRKAVVWSGDAACGWKNQRVSKEEIYACQSVETERGSVSRISHNDVTLSVAFSEQDDRLILAVEIQNDVDEPLMFDTDDWGAAHFRTRSDFLGGKAPLLAETSIPTRDTYREMNRRIKADNTIDEYLADMQQTVETVELRRQDGTRFRVKKTVPDVEQQDAAESRSESRRMMAKNNSEEIRRNALTVKTVGPRASVKGLVYFRRLKKARFVVFTMSLDDTNYIFLLPRADKGPA